MKFFFFFVREKRFLFRFSVCGNRPDAGYFRALSTDLLAIFKEFGYVIVNVV